MIRSEKMVSFTGIAYHGTSLVGLDGMIRHGIYGQQHGEVAEYESFSTSLNSNIFSFFSEGDGETGLTFNIQQANIVVLDDILTYLLTALPGSGLDADVDEEKLQKFVEKYMVPSKNWGSQNAYLPYNYLSSIGADGFVYDYTWKNYLRRHGNLGNDESEICFIGNYITRLNSMIEYITVKGNDYESGEKLVALEKIKELL
jgi:hypothetical protein